MSKPEETIKICIDPDTLHYSLECSNTYIEDIYVVLREIIYCLEIGDLSGVFKLEDSNGDPATNEQVRATIAELKSKIDESLRQQEGENFTTFHMVGDFRN